MKYYNKKTGEEITVLQAEKLRDNEKIVKYTGAKGEYSKFQQGNFMKVHPLDRI